MRRNFKLTKYLDETEKNSVLSCLEYILKNSTRFDIEGEILMKDLIDLGLPKGNCGSIVKIYSKNRDALKQKMKAQSMRSWSPSEKIWPNLVNRFSKIDFSIDEILGTKVGGELSMYPLSVANLGIEVDLLQGGGMDKWNVSMTKDQLDELIRGEIQNVGDWVDHFCRFVKGLEDYGEGEVG